MRYFALATDYDGTIALDGKLDDRTRSALVRCRETGRKIILVTGRQLDDLQSVCSDLGVFELVVAENGALLFNPKTNETQLLAEPPPPEFAEALRRKGVEKVGIGGVIVATWSPHEHTVLETIKEQGLELQVIFNKGAVMVLPSGVNKATGLRAALDELGLSRHNVVGVGDAENDHAFLSWCECSAAVANALDSVKAAVDIVTSVDHGAGVTELVERLMENDLDDIPTLPGIALSDDVAVEPYGKNILIAGDSGSGKSTLATTFLEALCENEYQFAIIDPEGDYDNFLETVVVGDALQAPNVEEVLKVLAKPEENVVVNLLGIPIDRRPEFFKIFFPRLQEMRSRTGHPYWIVIDEAHHMLSSPVGSGAFSETTSGIMMITVHPLEIAPDLLKRVHLVFTVGKNASELTGTIAEKMGVPKPGSVPSKPGEALLWSPGEKLRQFVARAPKSERTRHARKYAAGELLDEENFRFTGPENKLNLRAQNLQIFIQIAEGVDDETWLHHLRRHEYSEWFKNVIKDDELAAETRGIESADLSPAESRAQIKQAIEARYTK